MSSILLNGLGHDFDHSLIKKAIVCLSSQYKVTGNQNVLLIDSYYPTENTDGHLYVGMSKDEYFDSTRHAISISQEFFGPTKFALRPRPRAFELLHMLCPNEIRTISDSLIARHSLPGYEQDIEGNDFFLLLGYPTSVCWDLMSSSKNFIYLFTNDYEYYSFLRDCAY